MANLENKHSYHVDIKGCPIWYDRYGNGPRVALLIPGAVGTADSDFKSQVEGPNAFDRNKYTIIAVELQGWGRSRPPKKLYGPKTYEYDAECAHQLMQLLGFTSYSIIGWSHGAKVALIMAGKWTTRVLSVVAISVNIRITEKTASGLLATRNTKSWPQEVYDNYGRIYGDSLQKMWDSYCNFTFDLMKTNGDAHLADGLRNIRCPVLIIHGDKDVICNLDHALFIKEKISDSRLRRFADAQHNVHQQYPNEIKKTIEQFLKECDEDMSIF